MKCCDKCGVKIDDRQRGVFIYFDRYATEQNEYDLCIDCAREIQEIITNKGDE